METWTPIFYAATAATLFIAMIVLAWRKTSAPAVACVTFAGIVCCLLTSLSRFDSFSASPSEVRATMTRANSTLNQADVSLKRVTDLSVFEAKLLVRMIANPRLIRPGNGNKANIGRDDMRSKVIQEMIDLNFSGKEIKSVRLADQGQVADQFIKALYSEALPKLINQQTTLNVLTEKIGMSSYNLPSPDDMTDAFKGAGIVDPDADEIIKDYRYYLATGQFRRPDWWADRAEHSSHVSFVEPTDPFR